MAWKPLNDRLSDLPLVLAGPILRRTDETSVTVWVALKKPATVTLEVLEPGGVGPPRAWPRKLTSAATPTIKLGEWLYVTAVTTAPDSSLASILEPATTYAYNLTFNTSGYVSDLLDADVLTGRLAETVDISYFDHGLPTFVLPPWDLNKVRLAHGSCRKPHDPGRDGLAILDLLVEAAIDTPEDRPQQLFLTGDQIYAEEVVDPLLWLIMDAVRALTAWREILPELSLGASLTLDRHNTAVADLRPGTRTDVLKYDAWLTFHAETQLRSHVIGLAEYYAMYLFAWSQALWPVNLPTHGEAGMPRAGWKDGLERLEDFRKDIPAVRRVLANVPTYMIFDDHDVTDDWNISKSWCDNVLGRGLGKRLIQNALTAYAIFQHWGNEPSQFADGTPGAALLAEVKNLPTGTDPVSRVGMSRARARIDRYIGLPPGTRESTRWAARDVISGESRPAVESDREVFLARDDEAALVWDYVVRGPRYEVIVLDTRTWRGHYPKSPTDPPSMLSSVAFSRQLQKRLTPPAPGIELTCVIAPTNPVGLGIIDWLQTVTAAHAYPTSIGTFDYGDAWNFHEAAFATLLSTLFADGRQHVVLLSGDIHFGYAVKLSYWATKPFNRAPAPQAGVLAQLTASAFKNADFKEKFTKLAHTRAKQLLPEKKHHFVCWRRDSSPTLVVRDGRWKMELPPTTATVVELNGRPFLSVGGGAHQPHWRYEVEFAKRAPGHPPDAFLLPSMPRTDAALEWLALYYAAVSATAGAPILSAVTVWNTPWFQEGVEIVGLHNVGVVTFKWPDAGGLGKTVIQDLYFWPPGFTEEPHTFGHYEIPLDVGPTPPSLPVQPYP